MWLLFEDGDCLRGGGEGIYLRGRLFESGVYLRVVSTRRSMVVIIVPQLPRPGV